jgi:hypothetical protein
MPFDGQCAHDTTVLRYHAVCALIDERAAGATLAAY